MPLVNVMVNGRAYTIACDEGEEDHLRDLAGRVDSKAREVLNSVGQVGDTRLLLMAALLIADEHHDTLAKLDATNKEVGNLALLQTGLSERAAKSESLAADMLETASKRLEDLAVRLGRA